MPRDTQRHELLLQGAPLSDPALNRECGWLRRAGTLEPADAFPSGQVTVTALCVQKGVGDVSGSAHRHAHPSSSEEKAELFFPAFKHAVWNGWSGLSCNQPFK